jgi:magnesium transporter
MHLTVYNAQGSREVTTPPNWDALLASTSDVIWLDIIGPHEDDIKLMRDVFHFHPLAIEDTRNQRQRPKVDEYDDHLFAILNPVMQMDGEEIAFRELDVFVGRNYIVTVHPGAEPVIEEARQRVGQTRMGMPITAGYILYVLTDLVVDRYFPILDSIGAEVEALEQSLLDKPTQELLTRLFLLKRMLAELWRVVGQQRDMFNVLSRRDLPYMDAETLQYQLRDVYDHLLRITDMTGTYRDLLTSMVDLYMSSVSNRLNRVVNRLTVVTVIVGALAVITGFYGMNFETTWPPFAAEWGVPFVMLMMAAAVTLILLLFRRLGWF